MRIIIFGNGAISKTVQAINNFKKEIIVVDIDEKTEPDIVCDINDHYKIKTFVKEDDLLVDLTNDQNTFLIADWCYKNNVNYINADIGTIGSLNSKEKYNLFLKEREKRKDKGGKTILYSMGMNPGLVSAYMKKAIKDFSLEKKMIKEIHVSEIDSQISDKIAEKNTIIGTWCIQGIFEDGITESSLYKSDYWKNKLNLNKEAKNNIYWSKNPWYKKFNTILSGNHEEIYEIGMAYDSPVCFSYKPPVQFMESTKNLTNIKKYKKHIMTLDDTISGDNVVGIYILTKDKKEIFVGSKLNINQVKKLIKRKIKNLTLNATSVLTSAGVIAGINYILKNKNKGYIMPLDCDHDFLIKEAIPYLGEFYSDYLNTETFVKKDHEHLSVMTFNLFGREFPSFDDINYTLEKYNPDILCSQEDFGKNKFKNIWKYKCFHSCGKEKSKETLGCYTNNEQSLISSKKCIYTTPLKKFEEIEKRRNCIIFKYNDFIIANIHLEGGRFLDQYILKDDKTFEQLLKYKLYLLEKLFKSKKNTPDIIMGDFNSVYCSDKKRQSEFLNKQYKHYEKIKGSPLTIHEKTNIKRWNTIPIKYIKSKGYKYAKPENENKSITNGRGKSIIDFIFYKDDKLKFEKGEAKIIDVMKKHKFYSDKSVSDHNPVFAKFIIK
jgi:homospermidine synthase